MGDTGGDAVASVAFFIDNVVGFVFDEIGDVVLDVGGEEVGDFLTTDVGEGPEGKLGVAVLADLVGMDRLGVDAKIIGDASAKTGGIEDGARADDALGGETGEFDGVVGENIHGVGDDKKDTVEAGGHDLLDHTL